MSNDGSAPSNLLLPPRDSVHLGPPHPLPRNPQSRCWRAPGLLLVHYLQVALRSFMALSGGCCCQTEGEDQGSATCALDLKARDVARQGLIDIKPFCPTMEKQTEAHFYPETMLLSFKRRGVFVLFAGLQSKPRGEDDWPQSQACLPAEGKGVLAGWLPLPLARELAGPRERSILIGHWASSALWGCVATSGLAGQRPSAFLPSRVGYFSRLLLATFHRPWSDLLDGKFVPRKSATAKSFSLLLVSSHRHPPPGW